jgi:ribosome-associated heat shock protein Hsp15
MSRHGQAKPSSQSGDVDDSDDVPPGKVRLDKWLWAARFFKTRSLAAEAIDGGKVDVNGDRAKRAKLVQQGDRIRLRDGPLEWQLTVRDIAQRRGSAEIAQQLYEESAESQSRREAVQAHLRTMPSVFAHGDSRPGKHDRRAIRRLKGDR